MITDTQRPIEGLHLYKKCRASFRWADILCIMAAHDSTGSVSAGISDKY